MHQNKGGSEAASQRDKRGNNSSHAASNASVSASSMNQPQVVESQFEVINATAVAEDKSANDLSLKSSFISKVVD